MATTEKNYKVGIVMGSDSDMPVMAKAADILEELGIPYEMTVISAHREPDVFFRLDEVHDHSLWKSSRSDCSQKKTPVLKIQVKYRESHVRKEFPLQIPDDEYIACRLK